MSEQAAHVPGTTRRRLRGISEIRSFFRTNTSPVYFFGPTAFNLLGIDRWARNFHYVVYYDSWDGAHPRVFSPKSKPPVEFGSSEDVTKYLLRDPEVQAFIAAKGGRPKVAMVFLDEETERICAELGYELVLPSDALRRRLDSKIVTTVLGNEAGRPERAERPHRGRLVGHAGPRRHRRPAWAPTSSSRPPTATPARRRSSSPPSPTGPPAPTTSLGQHGQGHEADQQQGCGGRGRPDPARHDRRALHDRPHRISRAHAVPGRVVRQRPVPRRAVRRALHPGGRARPPAGREAGAGGLRRLLRGRRPRRPRHRRGLPR